MQSVSNRNAAAAEPADRVAGAGLFDSDINLQRLLEWRCPDELQRHRTRLSQFGDWVAGPLDRQAAYSDRFAPPRLDPYAGDGSHTGRIIFNSDYLACHAEAYRQGAVGLPYSVGGSSSHLVCFTMGYLLSHADIAIHCPVTMTGAVAHVLNTVAPAAVRDRFLPQLVRMDGQALSGGTWATELHGGSDVGATTTTAVPADADWRLNGLKWFTSNAGSGLALATARPGSAAGGKGLGCYLVPSHLDDGTPNHYRVRRLKEKLGTRALATAELDLNGCHAIEIAAPPDGLKVMMAALEYSRIHNAVGSAGMHRRAFLESVAWTTDRVAFGQSLRRFPMVQDQLLDMQMQLEAGVSLAFESVFAFDRSLSDPQGADWLRLATALAKYRTAEQCVQAARQSVEIIGGNGYTEEWVTARLYRDSLVTAVWEGPANIQALEVLRLVTDQRAGDSMFLARVGTILSDMPGNNRMRGAGDTIAILESAVEECRSALAWLRERPSEGPRHGRRLLDLLADTLAGALLAEEAVADLRLGDARKWRVASRFIRKVLGRADGIGPDYDPCNSEFDAVLAYETVD
jgi:acyl-CoA dehydrogenase